MEHFTSDMNNHDRSDHGMVEEIRNNPYKLHYKYSYKHVEQLPSGYPGVPSILDLIKPAFVEDAFIGNQSRKRDVIRMLRDRGLKPSKKTRRLVRLFGVSAVVEYYYSEFASSIMKRLRSRFPVYNPFL